MQKSKPRRLSPENRRAQLLKAALSCYASLGVMRAGHGDVAKQAGVSTATVFNYFPTRAKLTEAVFSEIYTVIERMFKKYAEAEVPDEGRLTALSITFQRLVDENPDLLKVLLNWSSTFSPEVRPAYLKFQDWAVKGIHAHSNVSGDNLSDARIVLATSYNYARMKLDGTDPQVRALYVDRVIEALDHP